MIKVEQTARWAPKATRRKTEDQKENQEIRMHDYVEELLEEFDFDDGELDQEEFLDEFVEV